MTKIKMFAGASLVGMLMMSSFALAAEVAPKTSAGTNAPITTTVVKKTVKKVTATQKACIATAQQDKTASMKTAKTVYQAALKDAKALTDKTAAKSATAAAKKAYNDAVKVANTTFATAKAS